MDITLTIFAQALAFAGLIWIVATKIWPPLLQAMRFVQWPIPFLDECAQRFGEVFTIRLPGRPPLVMVSHPDAIRELFTGDPDDLHAGESNAILEPLLGKHSLLLLDGSAHLHERRLVQPPFHGERMVSYGTTMRDIARRAIDAWPVGRPFAIQPEMQSITLDVILRTVFGLEVRVETYGRIMPAATVPLVFGSMRMNEPVAALRLYSSSSSGTCERSEMRPNSLSLSAVADLSRCSVLTSRR